MTTMPAFTGSAPVSADRLRWTPSTTARTRHVCSPVLPFFSSPQLSLPTAKSKSHTQAPSPPPSPSDVKSVPAKGAKPKGKTGKRVATYRKLQNRHQAGPSVFRTNAETLLTKDGVITKTKGSSMKEAYGLMSENRGEKTRRDRRNATELRDLKVGDRMDGVVHNTVRHGAYVDIGAKVDGLVHLRDMSVDFVHDVEDIVRPDDKLMVWIKYVDPVANVLALTMLPPACGFDVKRIPVDDVKVGMRVEGLVQRVTNFGAYVDAGFERHAWIHVRKLWGKSPGETLQSLRLGQKICGQVVHVDGVRSYIALTARGRAGVKLGEGVPIDIGGEEYSVSYGDGDRRREKGRRLDRTDIRARARLRTGNEFDDGFQTGTVQLTSDDGEEDDDELREEAEPVVVDDELDVMGLAAQLKAEEDDDDSADDFDDDDDDEFAFAKEMETMGQEDTAEEADFSEIAHMLTGDTEFIGLGPKEIERLQKLKNRLASAEISGKDNDGDVE